MNDNYDLKKLDFREQAESKVHLIQEHSKLPINQPIINPNFVEFLQLNTLRNNELFRSIMNDHK